MYPTSPPWDLFYYDQPSIGQLLDDAEFLGNMHLGATGLVVDSTPGFSALELRPNIGYYYTVALKFSADSIPDDFSDIDNSRLLLSVGSDEDNSIGVLISESGFAWVSGTDVSVLPGGTSIISEGGVYTVKIAVDGRKKVARLYITDESVGVEVFKYATVLDPAHGSDAVRIELMGGASIVIKEFLGSAHIVVSSLPPEVSITAPEKVAVGKYVALDGRGSTSKTGNPLEYMWQLVSVPFRSKYLVSAMGTTSNISTHPVYESIAVVGSEVDISRLSPGDIVTCQGRKSTVSQNTFAADHEWRVEGQIVVDDPIFPKSSNIALEVIYQDCINDPNSSFTFASPDISGTWTFTLTVVDTIAGQSSITETVRIQVEPSVLMSANALDMSMLWSLLGDQWTLVEDRDKIQAVWEAVSLAMSSLLLYIWQVGASKSLATIPRRFVRKWWLMPTSVDSSFFGPVVFDPKDPILPAYSRQEVTTTSTGSDFVFVYGGTTYTITFPAGTSIEQAAALINSKVPGLASTRSKRLVLWGDKHLRVEETTASVEFHIDSQKSYWDFEAQTLAYPDNSEESRKTLVFTDPVLDYFDGVKWVSVLASDGSFWLRQVVAYEETSKKLLLDRAVDIPLEACRVVVAPVFEQTYINLESIRWCPRDSVMFLRGDLQEPEYWDVVASDKVRTMVRPDPMVDSDELRVVSKLVKRDLIPVFDETVSIPTLRDNVETPGIVYKEGKDYVIEHNSESGASWVQFLNGRADPSQTGWWCEFIYIDADSTIYDNFGYLVEFSPQDMRNDQDYLQSVSGLFFLAFRSPSIRWVELGANIVASLPFTEKSGTILDIDGLWSSEYGRILIMTDDDRSIQTYYYPVSVGVAINPDTGMEFSVGDTVGERVPLAKGVEIVEGDNWGRLFGLTWLEQVHRYLVRLDSSIFPPELVSKLKNYLRRISPVWTDPMVSSVTNLEDGVDVQEDVSFEALLHPVDTLGQRLPSGFDPVSGDSDWFKNIVSADSGDHLNRIQRMGEERYHHPRIFWSRQVVDLDDLYGKRLWARYNDPTKPTIGDVPDEDVAAYIYTDTKAYIQNWWGFSRELTFSWSGASLDQGDAKYPQELGSIALGSGGQITSSISHPTEDVIAAEMWFHLDSALPGSAHQGLVEIFNLTASVSVSLYQNGTVTELQLYTHDSDGSSLYSRSWDVGTDWHHIYVVVDARINEVAVFADGIEQFYRKGTLPFPALDTLIFGKNSAVPIHVQQPLVRAPYTLPRGVVNLTRCIHPVVCPVYLGSFDDFKQLVEEIYPAFEVHTTFLPPHRFGVEVRVRSVEYGGQLAQNLRIGSGLYVEQPIDVDQSIYNIQSDVVVTLTENYNGQARADSIFLSDSGVHADGSVLTGDQTTSRILVD